MAEKKEIKNINGFVLRTTPYKEIDAMVTVLSSDGLFSFMARGVMKNTSKNFASCQLLAESNFSLSESKNGNIALVESKINKVPDSKGVLIRLGLFSFISEATLKLVTEDDASNIYPWLEKTMSNMEKEGKEASSVLIYLSHLLLEIGYGLEVSECVRCYKKTNIIGVSWKDGGFVCKDCANESEKLSTRDLKILRFCFKCSLEDVDRVSFEDEESLRLLKKLVLYIEGMTGVKLKSLDLI